MKKIVYFVIILVLAGSAIMFSSCAKPFGEPSDSDIQPPQERYSITFESNGGSEVKGYTNVKSGARVAEPTSPEKKYFTFGGWYQDAELREAWNFDARRVVANTTLYARWYAHFSYKDTAEGLVITGLTAEGKKIKNLEIPAMLGGANVVDLDRYAFLDCLNIESVVIPSGITNIASGAFNSCKNLTAITFPTSLTQIQSFAFAFCEKLTTITLPDELKDIGYGAFENCPNIETITVSSNSKLTTLGASNFDDTKWFKEQSNGFIYLNKLLFKYKGTLSAQSVVNITEGIVAIGENAFYEQSGLTQINFPQSLTTINERAFVRTGITTLKLTKNITDFSAMCLSQCDIKSISVEPENKAFCVKDGALYNMSESELVFFPNTDERSIFIVPEGVVAIGNQAFSYNENLVSVTLAQSVETIGINAFMGVKKIKALQVPENVSVIGQQAFDYSSIAYARMDGNVPNWDMKNPNIVFFVGADKVDEYKLAWNKPTNICKIYPIESLEGEFFVEGDTLSKYFGKDASVTVPAKVKVIGEYAFYRNYEMLSVSLPESVKEIKEYAFSNSGLQTITLPASLEKIGDSAFYFCQGLKGDFTIPKNVNQISARAFLSVFNLRNFVVDAENTRYYSRDGVLFDSEQKMLVCYPNRNGLVVGAPNEPSDYAVPAGIEKIGEYAFSYAFVKNVTLPQSLKTISDRAFFGSEYLCELIVPDGVTYIGENAFVNCVKLTSVEIPKSVIEWGEYPFRDFTTSQTVKFKGSRESIPSQVLSSDATFIFDYLA